MKWEEIILSALRTNGDVHLAIEKAMRIAPEKIYRAQIYWIPYIHYGSPF
jgi:hypothetical protein